MSKELVNKLRDRSGHCDDSNVVRDLCEAADRIEHLSFALSRCAAPFNTGPVTASESAGLIALEFQRRMDIAANAISYYCAECPTRGTCINLGRCVDRQETER